MLLVQVAALAQLVTEDRPRPGLAALVVSRLALPLACLRGVPAARPDGLGATGGRVGDAAMALSRSCSASAAVVGVVVLAGAPLVVAVAPRSGCWQGCCSAWRAVRRLGGVTGDVLGAAVEATFTASLVPAQPGTRAALTWAPVPHRPGRPLASR